MIIIDSHCDSPSQMLRLRDFSRDNHHAQVDFPKLKSGGMGGCFFALYIPSALKGAAATSYARRLLAETQRQVALCPDVKFATSTAEVKENYSKGLISILLGIENASAIGESLELVDRFYSQGVRYITLTHAEDNLVCDSCTGKGSWGGLSPFGKTLVGHMNRLGMMVDLAHCSEKTAWDALEVSQAPVVYTHGCCKALCSHRRNLSDDLLREIGRRGGVVGMSVYPPFLSEEYSAVLAASGLQKKSWIEDEFIADPANPDKRKAWENLQDKLLSLPRPGVRKVVDHIEHAIEFAGIDGVGIGTDFDGIDVSAEGLENVSLLGVIFDEMRGRGYSDSEVEKIAGLNWLSAMEKVTDFARKMGD